MSESALARLPNLGPKSAAALRRVGITRPEQLRQLGAVRVFLRLEQAGEHPRLNFLYALEGALQQRPWQQIAREERERLMFELGAVPPEAE